MKRSATRNSSSSPDEESRRLCRKLTFHLLLPALGVAVVIAILGWSHETPVLFWAGLAAMAAIAWLVYVARPPRPWLLLLGGTMVWLAALAILVLFICLAVFIKNPYVVLKALVFVVPSVPFGYALVGVSMRISRAQETSATKQNPYAELGTRKDREKENLRCS